MEPSREPVQASRFRGMREELVHGSGGGRISGVSQSPPVRQRPTFRSKPAPATGNRPEGATLMRIG